MLKGQKKGTVMPVFYLASLFLYHRTPYFISSLATWLSSVVARRYEQVDTKALLCKVSCENHESIALIQGTRGGRHGARGTAGGYNTRDMGREVRGKRLNSGKLGASVVWKDKRLNIWRKKGG